MRRRAAEISAAESDQRLPVPPAPRRAPPPGRDAERRCSTGSRSRSSASARSSTTRATSCARRSPCIKSELELALRYGGSREELRAALGSAIEETDRLSQLAENLLVLARSDKGILPIQSEQLEVRELFATAAGRLSDRARQADRALSVDDPDGLVVEADRLRIEQALTNLVENALRYGEGPVRLWARARDGAVELHVSDAGPGFPPDFLPHAFERFRRADPARGVGGVGLGLAIVDAIAQAHGGHAEARNAPDGGADVWIELDGSRIA